MRVTVTLQHGPFEIEIQASEDEDYQGELTEVLGFVDDHADEIEALTPAQPVQQPGQGGVDRERSSIAGDEAATLEGTRFAQISRSTGVDEGILMRMFDVPGDHEEIPSIIIEEFEEGKNTLGGSRAERQANASLMLLYLWQELRDVEKVTSSDLKDALNMSGIDPDELSNMYAALGGDADTYFNRTSGGTPTVKLSRRGHRAASNLIQDMAERVVD